MRKKPEGYEKRKAKRDKIAKEVSKQGVLKYLNGEKYHAQKKKGK